MEEIAGADLGWFFHQWLYRAGSPAVEGGWRYNAAARKIEIDLTQTQPGDAYRLPLEVAVDARTEKIEMTQKQQRFEIAADKEPAEVSLDPNTWMLMDTHFGRK
jgi:aminopeptidase N